ncbi:MAG: hypothetical protein A2X23_01075 [Chloroflexi bacterium GWC2_73_18]|nr:MAG: hypothetical protein A2X23_01075 [Chloroflexi bacterium GWC2_73_18]
MTRPVVPAVHVEPWHVRFDECTPDGTLRSSVYLRYLQAAAGIHSANAGYTRDWYAQAGLFWLVRTADLRILRPARVDETLHVSTEVIGFRRIWARRRSEVRREEGTLLAEAEIDWVMTSAATGRPARIPAELLERFPTPPADFDPGRVELAEPPADPAALVVDRRRVEPHEIDPMAHLNNAGYLDYIEAAVIAGGDEAALRRVPRRYRIEYLAPAEPGARLAGLAWRTVDGWAWRLRAESEVELARGLLSGG